ncbi:hypothetical protein LSAT2_006330 [Lamellibrachia satsuma]|nr:hypothetical protein LSAT2_006330 [Lamellibrachia satsuma]
MGHSGLFLLIVSVVLCSISCIAPYWLVNPNIQEYKGLFALCSGTRHRCYWFFEDDFAWQKSLDGWYKTCQGCFTAGLIILLVTLLIASLLACSIISRDTRVPAYSLCLSTLLAFSLMGTTIILFGVKAHYKWNAAMHGTAYLFTWSYFVGISGVLSTLLSSVSYMLDGCFMRTKTDSGYMRGNIY